MLGILVDGGVMRCRDIVDKMELRACTSRPHAERIVPLALARLAALGLAIRFGGANREWESTERGRGMWICYSNNVALELAAAVIR